MATMTHPSIPGPAITPAVVFQGVTWDDYEAMLRIVGERPIRVTYDRARTAIFMPSFGHEDDAHLLGLVVEALTDELNIPVKAGRSTTHRRRDLDRGTEVGPVRGDYHINYLYSPHFVHIAESPLSFHV
jgi:hypothetical protein